MRQTKVANQTGVTLLELLLALVVIAALIFVAARYFILARGNTQVAQAISRIDAITDASFRWVQGQKGDFCGSLKDDKCSDGINDEVLIKAGLISAKDMLNPWDTDKKFMVQATKVGANPRVGSAVAITLTNVPASACQSLQQKLKNRSSAVNCSGDTFQAIFSLDIIETTP